MRLLRLSEAVLPNISSEVAAFEKQMEAKYGLEMLSLYVDSQGHLKLADLIVPKERRGEGVGSRFMQELTDFADKHSRLLYLTVGEKGRVGTTSSGRLRDFYRRFGFVNNRGRHMRYDISASMYRHPLGESREQCSTLHEGRDDSEHWRTLAQTGFWGRQGAGAIFLAQDTGRLLIAHRSRSVEQPNTWGTWGGAMDEGETPRQAAEREVEEEAGYKGQFKIVPLYVFTKGDFKFHNFLVVVEREFTPKLDWETQGFQWVEYGDWPKPMHFGLEALIKNSGDEIQKHIELRESLNLTHNLHEAKRRVLYHVAPMKKLDRIKREGIQPQKKPSTYGAFGQDIRAVKQAIYAFADPVDALRWAGRMEMDSPGMKAQYVIIQFKTTADWQIDTHWEASTGQGDWLLSTEGVPPEDFLAVAPVDWKQIDARDFTLTYREPGQIQKWVGAPKTPPPEKDWSYDYFATAKPTPEENKQDALAFALAASKKFPQEKPPKFFPFTKDGWTVVIYTKTEEDNQKLKDFEAAWKRSQKESTLEEKDSVADWVRKLRGKSLYFRHQPKGKKLMGWTSEGSEERLPKGFVFAYHMDSPYEMLPWKATIDLDREEIVVFAGKEEHDPGDYEGVAVKPTKEVARLPLATFKEVAKVLDSDNSKAYDELVRESVSEAKSHMTPEDWHFFMSAESKEEAEAFVAAAKARNIFGNIRPQIRADKDFGWRVDAKTTTAREFHTAQDFEFNWREEWRKEHPEEDANNPDDFRDYTVYFDNAEDAANFHKAVRRKAWVDSADYFKDQTDVSVNAEVSEEGTLRKLAKEHRGKVE